MTPDEAANARGAPRTAAELERFILKDMRMSHIYQPLLILALVEAGGVATVRSIAQTFLLQDESQIRYYEERIRRMPLPVLRRREIVSFQDQLVRLSVEPLSYQQRAQIIMACQSRLQEFVARRGSATWDYRLLETDPVPSDLRYRVLAESNGRCALCGATSKERRLEADHIVPRSRGGTNDYENLQVLCEDCNRGKSNKDDRNFRSDRIDPPD